MIPVSLVVVVVGGWTAVYLTDLVLKVRASGLRPKPAVPRAGAQGPRPFLFPCLVPPGLEGVRPVPTCSFPLGARSGVVNKARLVLGGVWRPAQPPQSHCGSLQAPHP